MIINGGARSNGGFFASHLMRADHNERVEVRELRGLLAANVPDALREMAALACGTRCENWFYHADINTRDDERLSPEQWMTAADTLERELHLEGQPRFIVEHEKNGRTHQHIIWSRIDQDSMTAISDSHNFRRHEAAARALEQAFDHEATPGTLSREYGTERPARCPKDTEALRAQDSKIDPKAVTAEVTQLWKHADSGQAFAAALAERGYVLTRGDRRDFCLIDQAGDDHSLARRLSGVKATEVRARMGDIDRAALPSVAEGRVLARQRRDEASDSGSATVLEQAASTEAERREAPASLFDEVMEETRRQAAQTAHRDELEEPDEREDTPVTEGAALSLFDHVMHETKRLADHTAAAEEAKPDAERRTAGWQAWKANMRRHLSAMRGKIAEWWRDYFGIEPADSPQRGFER